MTTIKTFFARLVTGFQWFRSAAAVADAVQTHRKPRPVDLRILGIDPRAFTAIGHG